MDSEELRDFACRSENIMIMDHLQQPLRVKLIDFGLDCEVSEAQRASHIQDRWCRLVTANMTELWKQF